MQDLKAAWQQLKARVDELAAERQQYLDLFEHANDAYLLTDAHGTIRDANGAAVELLQRQKRALRGKPLAALVPMLARAEFRNSLSAAAAAEASGSWCTLLRCDEMVVQVEIVVRRMARGDLCWRLRTV
jgi:PAS domain S-box-containing protein